MPHANKHGRERSMKLLRYGDRGAEKPGVLDADGHIRDLSGVITDIEGDVLGPESLAATCKPRPVAPAARRGRAAHRSARRARAEIPRHRPQLPGSCRRDRDADSRGADRVHQGDLLRLRPERSDPDAGRLAAHGFRGRARFRRRQHGEEGAGGGRACFRRRLLHLQRRVGAELAKGRPRRMDQGQEL